MNFGACGLGLPVLNRTFRERRVKRKQVAICQTTKCMRLRASRLRPSCSCRCIRPIVSPNHSAINTDYGPCDKTEPLLALMQQAGLSPVWQNYCLKSTQVDYLAPDGTPTALGNAVIERIVGNGTVVASSCIACHAYASFGANGQPSKAATAMLPYNPTGTPIPAVLEGSLQFDFMWGVLLAPP